MKDDRSEALLAHDVYVCLERPSGALPPEVMRGREKEVRLAMRPVPLEATQMRIIKPLLL